MGQFIGCKMRPISTHRMAHRFAGSVRGVLLCVFEDTSAAMPPPSMDGMQLQLVGVFQFSLECESQRFVWRLCVNVMNSN